MAKRCYILGAGFSKTCGLPLASELTEAVLRYRDNHDAKLGLDGLRGTIEQQRTFIGELLPQCDLNTSYPDFEELMTVLEEWEDYRLACGGGKDPLIHGLKDSLIRNLHNLLCDQVGEARKTDSFKYVQNFVTLAGDGQSDIVSFNWDLLLEAVAEDIDFEVIYQKAKTRDANALYLAKPHGSLNLAELSEQDWEEKKNAINVGPRGMKTEWQDEQAGIRVMRIQNTATDPKGMVYTLGPIIVPPAARKAYESPWISRQWHLALDMVGNSEEVITIGYSLPETDIRPRLVIQLARFRREKDIPITLIDPCGKKLAEHFERFVGQPLTIIDANWEAVINDLGCTSKKRRQTSGYAGNTIIDD